MTLFVLSACGDDNSSEESAEESSGDEAEEADDTSSEEEASEEPAEEESEQLAYEIGEPFEYEDDLTGDPYEITVEEIWTEDGEEHQDYLDELGSDLKENANLTFITYTVKNIGDETEYLFNTIPEFDAYDAVSGGVDLTYPENDFPNEDIDDLRDVEIEPGETIEATGASDSTPYSENTGAYMWEITLDDPPIVLQTSLKDRKDAPGVYEFGEPIQVLDETEDRQLVSTIDNVELEEETEMDKDYEDSSWLVIDIKVENEGKKEMNVQEGFPDVINDDKPMSTNPPIRFDIGEDVIEQTSEDDKAIIPPGEELEGTLYINILNKNADETRLYYMDEAFISNTDFAQKINYNLE